MKILFFDCLSTTPFGKIIADTAINEGFAVTYVDAKKLPYKKAYSLKRALHKISQRKTSHLPYFYYPKLEAAGIEKYFATHKPDIVLVFGELYTLLDKASLLALKAKYKFKVVFFDTESANFMLNPNRFRHFIEEELSCYDKIFTFSKQVAHYFHTLGFYHAEFFAYGGEPMPNLNLAKQAQVLFIGTPDMRRLMTLQSLTEFPLAIYGKYWQRFEPLLNHALKQKIHYEDVWGEKLPPLLQSSKIILNINKIGWHSIESGINLRVFEALAAGSFLLTEDSTELRELFTPGEELETFSNQEELKAKIAYYLKHDTERERIAKQGQAKFLSLYTWPERVKILMQQIMS